MGTLTATTTTALNGTCIAPSLGEGGEYENASDCEGQFPPAACTVQCAAGYAGSATTYYCYTAEEGFVGTGPNCTSTTTTSSSITGTSTTDTVTTTTLSNTSSATNTSTSTSMTSTVTTITTSNTSTATTNTSTSISMTSTVTVTSSTATTTTYINGTCIALFEF